MFKKIDHVEIVTKNPGRSVEFYTGVMGFAEKLRQRFPLPGGDAWLAIVYLDLGGTGIELLTYEGAPVGAPTEDLELGYRMMALEVEDMKRALADLKTKGVEPSWGPVPIAEYTRAEVRDPDGNSIELREWNGSRASALKGGGA